jgi:hypothetical protein
MGSLKQGQMSWAHASMNHKPSTHAALDIARSLVRDPLVLPFPPSPASALLAPL